MKVIFTQGIYKNTKRTTGLTKCLRYIYHGYVQIAEIDATDKTTPYVTKTYRWDPSEPVATRPLALSLWTREGTVRETLYYAHDLRKNVVSLFDAQGMRRASYEYDPYGNITSMDGDMAKENPYRFSSEHDDDDLGLVYYNYRHYNPTDGRWTSRDPIAEKGGWNLYAFVGNRPIAENDLLGTQNVNNPTVTITKQIIYYNKVKPTISSHNPGESVLSSSSWIINVNCTDKCEPYTTESYERPLIFSTNVDSVLTVDKKSLIISVSGWANRRTNFDYVSVFAPGFSAATVSGIYAVSQGSTFLSIANSALRASWITLPITGAFIIFDENSWKHETIGYNFEYHVHCKREGEIITPVVQLLRKEIIPPPGFYSDTFYTKEFDTTESSRGTWDQFRDMQIKTRNAVLLTQ